MEKKEVRVKCSGCATSYKLKVPETDKPIRFQCKKCGKVLVVRLKSPAQTAEQSPPARPQPSPEMMPQLETTQLPEWSDDSASAPGQSVGMVETRYFDAPKEQPETMSAKDRRWLVLSDEQVKGPFNDDEIVEMIKNRSISAETSLRMGQRPWIKAVQVANFRDLFPESRPSEEIAQVGSGPRAQSSGAESHQGTAESPFYERLPAIVPYPLGGGKWQPLAVFVAGAFAVSIILSINFLIGLPLSILGWIVLYGYLAELMEASGQAPDDPPPAMSLSKIREMAAAGLRIFCVLAVYCLVPVSICLTLMIAFFLNGMEMLGYIFMILTVAAYAASLCLASAALVILRQSHRLGEALNPSKIFSIVGKGGKPYMMLASVSVGTGLICMLAVLAAVFLADLLPLGSIVVALLMALVLSYGHFIWFHVLGRYSRENVAFTDQVLAAAPSR